MPRLLTRGRCAVPDIGYRVAGFISEWWPTSNRNAGRLRLGMGGRLPSESAFDALASDRPYKKAWPPSQAIAYLRENAGRQFDPACVKAFVDGWSEIAEVYGLTPLDEAA
jgi:hypothetical protein